MKKKTSSKKLWAGGYSVKTNPLVDSFCCSIDQDERLTLHDIAGSIAHARMLGKTGVLSRKESQSLEKGLKQIAEKFQKGQFPLDPALEDVHMNVEAELTRRIGEAGKRLHTGRSRNDQVRTDLALYLRPALLDLMEAAHGLIAALQNRSKKYFDVMIPGYTHLQQAQPILLAHHLLAYGFLLSEDAERLMASFQMADRLPLGSAALAGTTIPIDRNFVKRELHFSSLLPNAMAAVGDRGAETQTVAACAIAMTHLSRLCEDLIFWNSQECGWIQLDDAFTTGSSIMPQKKNPDVAELVRGKSAMTIGNLNALLILQKGLPMAYNRDLQNDKKPLFDSLDTLCQSLRVLRPLLQSMKVDKARCAEILNPLTLATDLAEDLTEKGLPFRKAHEIVASLSADSRRKGKALTEYSLEELKGFSTRFDSTSLRRLDPKVAVEKRKSLGGTAPSAVKKQAKELDSRMKILKKFIQKNAVVRRPIASILLPGCL